MELEPPYLCITARHDELCWCCSDAQGQVVDRGRTEQTAAQFLDGWSGPTRTVGLGCANPGDITRLRDVATARGLIVRHCTWNDAALAGSLSGRPGVWLSMDHWIGLSGGCHSSDEACPDFGGQALGLAREANHRTVALVQAEASVDWLARQALHLATPQGGLSGFALQRVARALQPLATQAASPERSRLVTKRVQELADFPGPDPACLALLAKTARRLSDLMRHLCSRVRLSDPRAVWADGPLEGPLWSAMLSEFQRYLPDLSWTVPDHPPEVGVLLLLLGERKEIERQALNPNRGETAPPAPWAEFSQDAWRQLSRSQVDWV